MVPRENLFQAQGMASAEGLWQKSFFWWKLKEAARLGLSEQWGDNPEIRMEW